MNPLLKVLEGVIVTPSIRHAFAAVDRKDFLLPNYKQLAYEDISLPIGYGQTISQPYRVACMLEWLRPKQNDKILDIGAGSGWTTALLAYIAGEAGEVVGTEIVPQLVAFGRSNLEKYDFPQACILQARTLGHPKAAPYDRILASAPSDTFPQSLLDQLKENGKLVVSVEDTIWEVMKTRSDYMIRKYPGFAFVPLNVSG